MMSAPKATTFGRQACRPLSAPWIGVIQGHHWCRQKARTGWRQNVQCLSYFWKLRRYSNEKTANSSISTTPLGPLRFEHLQI